MLCIFFLSSPHSHIINIAFSLYEFVSQILYIVLQFVQDIENGKLRLEHVQIVEENSGLHVQNQKLSEEALYAKELASAAAVELKNLAGEVTKLSLQNGKLEKELLAARDMLNSRSSIALTGNVGNRKHGENLRTGRRGRITGRGSEIPGAIHDDFNTWDLDPEDLKMELQARKQREAALEAVLSEKEVVEDEYRKKVEEGKKREAALENDLANMWVLVAQLKKEAGSRQDSKLAAERQNVEDRLNDVKINDINQKEPNLADSLSVNHTTDIAEGPKEEPLVARLKVILISISFHLSAQILPHLFVFKRISLFIL